MSKFHKLTVSDIKSETPDCVSVTFEVPSNLIQDYKYLQGQHLTLKLLVNGKEVRRSYSLCSSPLVGEPMRVAVKRVKGGTGSNFINDNFKKGYELEVMTPMGNFHTELKSTNRKHYVLFAGGSGITPMMSIIKTTLIAEPQSKLTLFYGNFDETATIFKKELDEIVARNPGRVTLHYIFEKPATPGFPADLVGMLTKDKVKELISKYLDRNPVIEYFICGPGPMMDNVKDVLESNNVNKNFIHIEYFTSVIEEPKKDPNDIKGSICEVTVIADGNETTFQLATDGDAILDAAMDAGVDAPFSCKGAVCATCRAKLMEGKVEMTMNYALTDDEVEDGYILTCQAHPITPVVVVDYDRG
ncbi:MAG TPA: 2Fe-2S iron-sulfur cluster-binding protein [Bacteroidia bacterium]|nr:2Fe-2S iron-sulfur cluster-binding protein [Bacteroidia bacterium]